MPTNPIAPTGEIAISQKFNIGTAPSDPVVEQNSTYMAYFEGVGGTGPELIDQTAYIIRYLIDTKGNVTNPEPIDDITDPSSVPLFNLLDTFEPGKNAVVKLISADPLETSNPNDDALTGIHPISYVGRISPILVTETGTGDLDYVTTMSFGDPLAFVSGPIPDIGLLIRGASSGTETSRTALSYSPFNYPYTEYNNQGAWSISGNTITAQSSSITTQTRVRFRVAWTLKKNVLETYFGFLLKKNGSQVLMSPPLIYVNSATYGSNSWIYASNYVDFVPGDTFEITYFVGSDPASQVISNDYYCWVRIEQETSAGPGGFPAAINGTNAIYAFNRAGINGQVFCGLFDNPQENVSYMQFQSASLSIYNSGLVQNLPTASQAMGFSPITIPFGDVRRGDFVRFGYDKNKVFTILNVDSTDPFGLDRLTITITPNVGSTFDANYSLQTLGHFVIYRIINDGSWVILDVPKPSSGNGFSGIIMPEFSSNELKDNYDKIITDLTSKEIIN
jgi:hypothetical protein